MAHALIALGSNLGDRRETLRRANTAVSDSPQTRILKSSQLYASQPAGGPKGQGEFLNGAVLLETALPPEQLLTAMQTIEHSLGRQRHQRWDARTIDIDLLLYGERIIDTASLVLPHPRMSFRAFVLEPAAEVAPIMRHPRIGWTIDELRKHIATVDPWITLIGPQKEDVAWLAERMRDRLSCRISADLQTTDGLCWQHVTFVGAANDEATGLTDRTAVELSQEQPALIVGLDAPDKFLMNRGPALRLIGVSRESMFEEVAAAIPAMQAVCRSPD